MTERTRTLRENLAPDTIRVPVEREVARALRLDPLAQRLLRSLPPRDLGRARRELAATALLLSEAMAPEVHDLLREVKTALGVPNAVEVYQGAGQGGDALNVAVIYTAEDPILLLVQGRLLTNLDPEGQLLVLGHELGHYLAHGPGWPQTDMARVAFEIRLGAIPAPNLMAMASSFGMAMELTADRFGLLVAQDLDVFLRVQMVTTSGLPIGEVPWEPKAYLEGCRELMEKTLEAGESAVGWSHPEHNLRSYAGWLFSETDAYERLTGKGPGSRRLEEVDGTIGRLIRPPAPGARPFGARPGRPGPAAPGPAGPTRRVVVDDGPAEVWEDLGKDVSTVLGNVGSAIGRASKKVAPGLERLKTATAEGVARVLDRAGGRGSPGARRRDEEPGDEGSGDDIDPLADDDRALLDRFAELERKEREAGPRRPGPPREAPRAAAPDPLADDDRALLDRFAELERKEREPSRPRAAETDDDLKARLAELERKMKAGR